MANETNCPHLRQNRAYGLVNGVMQDIGINCDDCRRYVAEPPTAPNPEPQPSLSAAVETLEKALRDDDDMYVRDSTRPALLYRAIESALQQLQGVPAEKD